MDWKLLSATHWSLQLSPILLLCPPSKMKTGSSTELPFNFPFVRFLKYVYNWERNDPWTQRKKILVKIKIHIFLNWIKKRIWRWSRQRKQLFPSQHFSVLPTFSLSSQTSRAWGEILSPFHWVGALILKVVLKKLKLAALREKQKWHIFI